MRLSIAIVARALGCLLFGSFSAAEGGVLIVQRTATDGKPRTSEVQIDAQRMRAEIDSGLGGPRTMIFDGAKQVLYLIDTTRKTYGEMTKADADRMGAQMAGMMEKMQSMFKNMPPEQRAKMEAMMKGQGGPGGIPSPAASLARVEYKKTGTAKVGKWACDTYEGYQGGQKVSDVCTVAPEALGLTPADFAVTKQMADFFQAIMPQSAGALLQLGRPEEKGFSGVPVRQSTIIAGHVVTNEIVEISRKSFEPTTFAVPAGFTKDPYPFGPR